MKKYTPSDLLYYFAGEKKVLLYVTISGLIYNVGMTLSPWFEGQLAQYVIDILGGERAPSAMLRLASLYLLTIMIVQGCRALKRLYVRHFANDISLAMKAILYRTLIHQETAKAGETEGSLMTRVVSDVDACVEGMRKFTTEVFDTGVVMVAYAALLFYYDWKLTFLVLLFPPIAYFIAGRLKKVVTDSARAGKESSGRLSDRTMDRIRNALTYRIFGEETAQDGIYETYLADYEKKTVRANLWGNTMEPLYEVIAMTGAFFIIVHGGRNVMGTGWASWDIAAFSAYLACFARLAVKASHAAHLFNAVQKAKVSWVRVRPYLKDIEETEQKVSPSATLSVSHVSFTYPGGDHPIYKDFNLEAKPGEFIGVTGEVASGKSTLGRTFLCEYPYEGTILYGGKRLGSEIDPIGTVGYMGHRPELFSGTIEDNIRLGKPGDLDAVLKAVEMDKEISSFPDGIHTMIGEGGLRLSGGQQARVALARTLYHKRPLLILDDPFSAVDRKTEEEILTNIRPMLKDSIVILISHRLHFFKDFDRVVWISGDGSVEVLPHEELLSRNREYRRLWKMQHALAEGRDDK